MADKRVDIDGLADAITMTLDEYFEKVDKDVYRVGHKAIIKLKDKTIDTAPIGHRARFRDHIAARSTRKRLDRSEHLWYVKAPEYRLTHLLVHGHAKRNGGRTKPNPFLANALKEVLKEYEEGVEEAIRRG